MALKHRESPLECKELNENSSKFKFAQMVDLRDVIISILENFCDS